MQFLRDEEPEKENPLLEFEDPHARARRLKNMPCPDVKLVPTNDMMPRNASLRHNFLAKAGVTRGIRVMEGLAKAEDPEVVAKREAILNGIREKELNDARKKQSAKKKDDRKNLLVASVRRGSISLMAMEEQLKEEKSEGEGEDDDGGRESPDLSLFRKTVFYKAASPTQHREGDEDEDGEDYPDEFSFLLDWKSDQKKGFRW